MPYSTAAKNLMLDALGAAADFVSAHTDDPGSNGANEVTGGSYARQPIAWNAASGGVMDDSTNGALIPVPAATTVKYIGFWTAISGGTWLGSINVTDEVFANAGVYNFTDGDLDLNA